MGKIRHSISYNDGVLPIYGKSASALHGEIYLDANSDLAIAGPAGQATKILLLVNSALRAYVSPTAPHFKTYGDSTTGVAAPVYSAEIPNAVGNRAGYAITNNSSGLIGGITGELVTAGGYPSSVGKVDIWVQNAAQTYKTLTTEHNRVLVNASNVTRFIVEPDLISINPDGTERWNFSGSNVFQYRQNSYIQAVSSDGDDDLSVTVCGGGGNSSARGALLGLFGNEHSTNAGNVILASGAAANSRVYISANGTSDTYINLAVGGSDRVRIVDTGIRYVVSDFRITANTNDGSDTSSVSIGGGGDISTARGGYIKICGAENAAAGQIAIMAGEGGYLRLATYDAQAIYFDTAHSTRWLINGSGHFQPYTNNLHDIGLITRRVKKYWGVDADFSGDVHITGDLTVDGDSVELNTQTLNVEDTEITLAHAFTGSPVLDGGILLNRGSEADAAVRWNEADNRWEIGTIGDMNPIVSGTPSLGDFAVFDNSAWLQWRNAADDEDYEILTLDTNNDTILQGADKLILRSDTAGTSGSSDSIFFQTGTTDRWVIENAGNMYPGTDMNLTMGTTGRRINTVYAQKHYMANGDVSLGTVGSGTIKFDPLGITKWKILTDGTLEQQSTGVDIVFTQDMTIRSSGDARVLSLAGGSSTNTANGSYIILSGNSDAFAGAVEIKSGAVAGGNIILDVSSNANALALRIGGINSHVISGYQHQFDIRDKPIGDITQYQFNGNNKTITSNETHFCRTFEVQSRNVPINSGVTDSGYRVALAVENYFNTASFAGTLAEQTGIWCRTGDNTTNPTGTITVSYGLLLEHLQSGSVSYTNQPWGIYQTSNAGLGTSGIRNYFEGRIGIAVQPSSDTALDVSGRIQARSDLRYTPTRFQILPNTSDGADTKSVVLLGGGGASATRGARVEVFGNEHAGSAGEAHIVAPTNLRLSADNEVYYGTSAGAASTFWAVGNTYLRFYNDAILKANTSDGADNLSLSLASGGEASDGRGSYIKLYGNEHASQAGKVQIYGGNVSNGDIDFITSNTLKFSIEADSNSILRFGAGNGFVLGPTADGADNRSLELSAAGSIGASRGAYVQLYGNEGTAPGYVNIVAGNAAGNKIVLSTSASERWHVIDSGHLIPQSTLNIGSASNHVGTIYVDDIVGVNPTSLDVIPNNVYLQWRNAANDANFDILKVDSNDNTVLTSSEKLYFTAANDSKFFIDDAASHITSIISENATFNLVSTSGGNIKLIGNGSTYSSYISCFGDYANHDGDVDIIADGQIFLEARGTPAGDTPQIEFLTGPSRWYFRYAELISTAGTTYLRPNTSDGSDTSSMVLTGGGAGGNSRGGYVRVFGNEYPSYTGKVVIEAGTNSGTIDFHTNGAKQAFFDSSGHLAFPSPSDTAKGIYLDIDGSAVAKGINIAASNVFSVLDTAIVNIQSVAQGGNLDLYSGTGGEINFKPNVGTPRWSIPDTGAVASFKYHNVGKIFSATADGSDNLYIEICGGGDANRNRGSYITIHGNEYGSNQGIILNSGEHATDGDVLITSGVPGNNGKTTWKFHGDQLRFIANSTTLSGICATTSDGSDSKALYLTGAGAYGITRGAYMFLAGNESTGTPYEYGSAYVFTGDHASAYLHLQSENHIEFYSDGTKRFEIDVAGSLLPALSETYNIGSSSARIKEVHGTLVESVTDNATAAGTTQATATQITSTRTAFMTIDEGVNDGAVLIGPVGLSGTVPGRVYTVYNRHATDTLKVYPEAGGEIDDLGTNNPYEIGPLKSATFTAFGPYQWYAEASGGSGTGYNYVEVTTTSQAGDENFEYVCNNSSQVTVTLPTTIEEGAKIRLVGKGAGGWKLAQNAGQQIHYGSLSTTSGASGYLASDSQYDVVEVICITENTTFVVISGIGNIDIV